MFTALGNIMKLKVSTSPLLKGATASLVVEKTNEFLREMFGLPIEGLAQAVYLKHRSLTIACMNSTISQEIRLREGELIDKLRRHFEDVSLVERCSYLLE